MDKQELQRLFEKYCQKLRLTPAWDVKLELVEDPAWPKTGDFKIDCDDRKARKNPYIILLPMCPEVSMIKSKKKASSASGSKMRFLETRNVFALSCTESRKPKNRKSLRMKLLMSNNCLINYMDI